MEQQYMYLCGAVCFQEKRNVHYYFDQTSGCWVRIPIAWELKHDLVRTLLGPIEVRGILA